jgi:peptide/nickel transport system substrate-binding protein
VRTPATSPLSRARPGRPAQHLRRLVLGGLAGAALLTGCSRPAGPTSPHAARRAPAPAATRGGTAVFAEQPSSAAFYTFPLTPISIGSLYTITQFQDLLWRPLYWFGNHGRPTLNELLSLAYQPRYSHGGRMVTIHLKPYHWSDGQPVTARDVLFWMNLLKAEKDNWSAYVAGGFPDNVTRMQVSGPRTITFTLNRSYGSNWFTYNELSQIIPIPQHAWDKTRTSGRVGSYDSTTSGARAVYRYLTSQARRYSAYATNPLWRIVDGPWRISAFDTDGYVRFAPNPRYSGPDRPHLAHLVEEPFTSATAEVNELLSKRVDYGYLPPEDLRLRSRLEADGYRLVPTYSWSINFMPINYHNPEVGALFHQLYMRQALQHLVDQPEIIKQAFHGYAAPVYGPVPLLPKNPFVTAYEATNPYPYDPSRAKALLARHGWQVRPSGVTTCVRPGAGPDDCGAGIARGAGLTFHVAYWNGQPGLPQAMQFLATSFSQAGIKLDLEGEPLGSVNSSYSMCRTTQAICKWQMISGGLAWTYLPDFSPSGEELFATTGASNASSYSDPTADRLIAASYEHGVGALKAYENYLAKDLPVIWLPAPATITVVKEDLGGTQPNDPFFLLYASQWYLKK